jgi:hypothetical protein
MDEATTIIPLAHLPHWYFMPLYAAPILIVLYSTIRQRREAAGDSKPSGKDGRRRR